jgi:DNA-binding transcriptional LysR family regulator
MELRHLRYFVAVADELHFGRAAKRLNIAQPPLSQQIRDLEHELGAPLFLRTSRRVQLTAHGRLFLAEARDILGHAQRAREMVKASQRGEFGSISIGFVTSAIYSVMTPTLRGFHSQFPQVEIRCHEMATPDQINALHKGDISVGFLRTPISDDSIRTHLLLREFLVLVLPEHHPAARKSKLQLRDFASEPFILFPRKQGPGAYDQIISTCQSAGFSPILAQEGNEMQSMLGLVAAGLGISLVPASLRNLRRPGVVYKTLTEPTSEIEISLAIRKGENDPVEQSFIDVALRIAKRFKTRGK